MYPATARALLQSLVIVVCGQAEGADDSDGEARAGQTRGPTYTMTPCKVPPKVDGHLDDDAWALAPRATAFQQADPEQGAPPSFSTEFAVVRDEETLWIAVSCRDDRPDKIVANELRRDGSLMADDHVTVVLDTFLDRRNAYLFRVNAAGARGDALVTNNATINNNWDGIWKARAKIDDAGWSLEIALPADTLAFDANSDTWGLNISRRIARKYETVRWAGAEQRLRDHTVSEAGRLRGVAGLKHGLGLELRPYVLGRVRDQRRIDDVDTTGDLGGDLALRITPDLTASLSWNTDFAETEVDSRQINLTRFPLFFPEKREFFLEDAGIFHFGNSASGLVPFFSRRLGLSDAGEVVPIEAAAKLTGRIGDYNLGLLGTALGAHDDVDRRGAFVGRVSRNIFDSSSVGAILTAGAPDSSNDNLLVGSDIVLRNTTLSDNWVLGADAFLIGTWTEDRPGNRNLAWSAQAFGEHESVVTSAKIFQIDKHFNAALGFVPRIGIRSYENEITFRPLVPGVSWLRRYFLSWFSRHVTDLSNRLETALHSLTPVFLSLESGDELFVNVRNHLDAPRGEFEIHPGVVIPPGDYWYQTYRVGFVTASRRQLEGNLGYEFGSFYDGHRQRVNGGCRWKPTRHVHLGLDYDAQWIDLPEGNFTTRLASVTLDLLWSADLAWRNLLQYDDLSDVIGLSSRLEWEFRPGGTLYLVLQENIDRNQGRLRVQETEWTAKISIAFRF